MRSLRTIIYKVYCLMLSLIIVAGLNNSLAQGISEKEEKSAIEKEKKEWRKKAKYYKRNPLILKAREDALEAEREQIRIEREKCQNAYTDLDRILQSEKHDVQRELLASRLELDSMQRVEDSLRFAVNFLADSLEEIHAKKKHKQNEDATQYKRQVSALKRAVIGTDSTTSGITYSVQIGAIYKGRSRNLPLSLENFIVDTIDGLNQYSIGRFSDIGTATSFRNEVRQFGIKDAFVVAYQDGERITLRKAKKELKKQPNQNQLENRSRVETEELRERLKGLEEEKKRLQFQIDTVKSSRRQAQLELQRVQKLYELTLREMNAINQAGNMEMQLINPAETSGQIQSNGATTANTYKVQIYSGSFRGAEMYKEKCIKKKILETVNIEFESPQHKVRIGNFKSYNEAIRYRDEIRLYFPDAFVVRR